MGFDWRNHDTLSMDFQQTLTETPAMANHSGHARHASTQADGLVQELFQHESAADFGAALQAPLDS